MRHAVGLSLLALPACADVGLAEETSAISVDNGQNLNGQNLNGQNLNGQNLNGQNLDGPDAGTFTIWTSLDGVKLHGKMFDATLDKTVFYGFDGRTNKSGMDFLGAELWARRGDGRDVKLRVTDIVPGEPLWRYYVEYREDDGLWYPICEDDTGTRPAFALSGTWDHQQGVPGGGSHVADPRKFTFACEGMGAIGKCAGFGYYPFAWAGGPSLADHHQACVRLLRADFCGDGTPYTRNGNRVNLYDDVGIEDDTEHWFIEAEWDAQGARCFYPLNRSRAAVPCYNARVELFCGAKSHFDSGALLMDETPTLGLTP